jgi:hypothetical protein
MRGAPIESMERKDPNQGEGDRASARRYDKHAREFVHEGKVEPAADEAKRYVENDPEGAARAERATRHGPHGMRAMIEEIFGAGRAMVERWRAKLAKKPR